MQDHEFEKQVRRKMEELNIHPSGVVWDKVDAEINRSKKRRRWLLWLPLLIAGLLTGGYLIFDSWYANGSKSPGTLSRQPYKTPKRFPPQNNTGNTTPTENDVNQTERNDLNDPGGKTPRPNLSPRRTVKEQVTYRKQIKKVSRTLKGTRQPFFRSGPTLLREGNIRNINAEDRPETNDYEADTEKQVRYPDTTNAVTSPGKREIKAAVIRYAEAPQERINIVPKSFSSSSSINSRPPVIQSAKRWEWGVTLKGGRTSGSTRGSENKSFSGPAANFSGMSGQPGTNTFSAPSPASNGSGFSAGTVVSRKLNRTLSVSAGLSYNLYTTKQKTGKNVDSVITVRASNEFDRITTAAYAGTGALQTFTNRYHFIELPLSLQARLLKNEKIPLSWSFGVTLSRLIAADALLLDNSSRIYYKNKELLNNTQVHVTTGMNMRFLQRDRLSIQAGPSLQYSLSKLVRGSNYGNVHLLFLGLKTQVIFHKK